MIEFVINHMLFESVLLLIAVHKISVHELHDKKQNSLIIR